MLIKIPVVALILMAQFTTYEWVLPTLAALMFLFSMVFYQMILKVMMTIAESVVETENREDLMNASLSILMNVAAMAVLYYSPYALVTAFIAPWIILTAINTMWAWLLHLKYFEIIHKDDE